MGEFKMIEVIAAHLLTGAVADELLELAKQNTGEENSPSAKDSTKG